MNFIKMVFGLTGFGLAGSYKKDCGFRRLVMYSMNGS